MSTPETRPETPAETKPRIRLNSCGSPIDGQTVTVDAVDAFRFVEGVVQRLEDLSKIIDNLEVSMTRADGVLPSGNARLKELHELCASYVQDLREERICLGVDVEDLHELIIGDAYEVHNAEQERRLAAKKTTGEVTS